MLLLPICSNYKPIVVNKLEMPTTSFPEIFVASLNLQNTVNLHFINIILIHSLDDHEKRCEELSDLCQHQQYIAPTNTYEDLQEYTKTSILVLSRRNNLTSNSQEE